MTTQPANENVLEVLVCSRCLRASCWYGELMCDDAQSAGLVVIPVDELHKLHREHPSYWTRDKFEKVYGTRHPRFTGEPLWNAERAVSS